MAQTYQKLLQMGFEETIALSAANKYFKNIDRAIEYVLTNAPEDTQETEQTTSMPKWFYRIYDIWTDDFDEFESIMSEFPAQASIKDIRLCVVDIEALMEDESLHFDSMDIVQITFVNPYRLAVLAKLQSTKGRQTKTCLLTINLKKTE
eukprot:774560_1